MDDQDDEKKLAALRGIIRELARQRAWEDYLVSLQPRKKRKRTSIQKVKFLVRSMIMKKA